MKQGPKRIMVVAGEASGDMHAANLVRAMKARNPDFVFFGIGGAAMKRSGVQILSASERLSVVGLTEVFTKIPDLFSALRTARRALARLHPDLLILLDFPDFNLHLAGVAKRRGVPVLYYISPQIWAWRSGRIRKIARRVDHMAVILPFEEELYRRQGIPATFVGHPLLDAPRMVPRCMHRPGGEVVTIGLLPGSRDREVLRHLPLMLEAARLLRDRLPGVRFLVSLAPGVREEILSLPSDADVEPVRGPVDGLFDRVDLVMAVSGTVTLEAALRLVPMLILYRVSSLSYGIGKRLIRVPHVGLINLIAQEEVVPELIQGDAVPEKMADTVMDMIRRPGGLDRIRERLSRAVSLLGDAGASENTARIAERILHGERRFPERRKAGMLP